MGIREPSRFPLNSAPRTVRTGRPFTTTPPGRACSSRLQPGEGVRGERAGWAVFGAEELEHRGPVGFQNSGQGR
jgi:hypothetical protein